MQKKIFKRLLALLLVLALLPVSALTAVPVAADDDGPPVRNPDMPYNSSIDWVIDTPYTFDFMDYYSGENLVFKVRPNNTDFIDLEGSTYTYTPTEYGTHCICVQVSQGGTQMGDNIYLKVKAADGANTPPTLKNSQFENQVIEYMWSGNTSRNYNLESWFEDLDGDALTYYFQLNDDEPVALDRTTYTISAASQEERVAAYKFYVSDGQANSLSYTFIITVNSFPNFSGTTSQGTLVNEPYDFGFYNINDSDGDTLSFSVSIDGADPVEVGTDYTYTPIEEGTTRFDVTMTDGYQEGTRTYNVTAFNFYQVTAAIAEEQSEFGTVSAEFINVQPSGVRWKISETPNPGYRFVEWLNPDGSRYSTSASGYLNVTEDSEMTAVFKENSAPELKSGVESVTEAEITTADYYRIRGRDIFTDADNDTLAYYVSVDGGEPQDIGTGYYYYYGPAAGNYTLVFTAWDGDTSSETHTVNVTATLSPTLTDYKFNILSDEPLTGENSIGAEMSYSASFSETAAYADLNGMFIDSRAESYNISMENYGDINETTPLNAIKVDDLMVPMNSVSTSWTSFTSSGGVDFMLRIRSGRLLIYINSPYPEKDIDIQFIFHELEPTAIMAVDETTAQAEFIKNTFEGSQWQLTATGKEGEVFSHWEYRTEKEGENFTGEYSKLLGSNGQSALSLVIEQDTEFLAVYSQTAPEPIFKSVNDSKGTVSAAAIGINEWQLEATANQGFVFYVWSDGNENSARTVSLTEEVKYTAYFIPTKTAEIKWGSESSYEMSATITTYWSSKYDTSVQTLNSGNTSAEFSPERLTLFSSGVGRDSYNSIDYEFVGWTVNGILISVDDIMEEGIYSPPGIGDFNSNYRYVYGVVEELGLKIIAYGYFNTSPVYRENGTWGLYLVNDRNATTYNISDEPDKMEILTDITVEALFAPITLKSYTAAVTTNDDDMGSVQAELVEGTPKNVWKLTATPNEGYEFIEWSDGDQFAVNVVVLTEDSSYTATFRQKSAEIQIPVSTTANFDDAEIWTKVSAEGDNNYLLETGTKSDYFYTFSHWEYRTQKEGDIFTGEYTVDEASVGQKLYMISTEDDIEYRAVYTRKPLEMTVLDDKMGIYVLADDDYYPGMRTNSDTGGDVTNSAGGKFYIENLAPEWPGRLGEATPPERYVFSSTAAYDVEAESGQVAAYDAAVLWYNFEFNQPVTDFYAELYAGNEAAGTPLFATESLSFIRGAAGIATIYFPIYAMPYTENVTIKYWVGNAEPAVITLPLAVAMIDTGLLDARAVATSQILTKFEQYKTEMAQDSPIYYYSSEYLMMNREFRDGLDAVVDATSVAEITQVMNTCLQHMEDATNNIFHQGVKVGEVINGSLVIVTVPTNVNILAARAAASEHVNPGNWWRGMTQGGAWASIPIPEDWTGPRIGIIHIGGPVQGTYAIWSAAGPVGFANGITVQSVWDGLIDPAGNYTLYSYTEGEPVKVTPGSIGSMQWDLALLRERYSDEELLENAAFVNALNNQYKPIVTTSGSGMFAMLNNRNYILDPNNEEDIPKIAAWKALRLAYLDFLLADATQVTRDVIRQIAALTLDGSEEARAAIQAARQDYDALESGSKSAVFNYGDLTAAEIYLIEDEDERNAKLLDIQIDSIGTVEYTQESLDKINAAKSAYDEGSERMKGFVTKKADLDAAIAEFESLKAGAVSDVQELITDLPALEELAYPDDYQAIQAARAALDALLQSEQADFDAELLTKLENSESKISELRTELLDSYNADEAQDKVLAYIKANVANPTTASVGGEWAVLAEARGAALTVEDEWAQTYLSNLDNRLAGGGTLAVTEYERFTLAVTALGLDASDYKGSDLTEAFATYKDDMMINQMTFALIALDANIYAGDRQEYVDALVDQALSTGGWALLGDSADVDVTAMAIQALAPYYSQNQVKVVVDKGLTVLQELQDEETGGFTGYSSTVSTCSIAQVLTALSSLGIDPTATDWTTESGLNVVSALFTYYDEENGYFGETSTNLNNMATEQAAYALVAYNRYIDGENTLYDMTDVAPVTPIEVDLRTSGNAGDIFEVSDYTIPVGEVTEDTFTLENQTALGALVCYCQENDIDIELQESSYGIYVYQIGTESSDENSWMYYVNGSSPAYGAAQYQLSEGDSIHWVNYTLGRYSLSLSLDKTQTVPGDDITATVSYSDGDGIVSTVADADIYISSTTDDYGNPVASSVGAGTTGADGELTFAWDEAGTYYPYAVWNDKNTLYQYPVVSFNCTMTGPIQLPFKLELVSGWNTLSTPASLAEGHNTLGDILDITDYDLAYAYNSLTDIWELVDADYQLKPCQAIFIKMSVGKKIELEFNPELTSPPTVDLRAGWNLVGLANWSSLKVTEALITLENVQSGIARYDLVLSPYNGNQSGWSYIRGQQISDDEGDGWMQPGYGYWLYMNSDGTLAGLTSTPVRIK
jgi:hypothetical protein